MTPPRLERDLNAHRMSDEDGSRNAGVVENRSDIIRKIRDRNATHVARRLGPSVSAVVRMQDASGRNGTAQIAPHVSVAADAIAQRDRRAHVTPVVIAVEQPRSVAR